MSCRSRAKRLRSSSTASRAFSSLARTRSRLRAITCRMPHIAKAAASTANVRLPSWSQPGDRRAETTSYGHDQHQREGERQPGRQQHHAGDREVDRGRGPLLAQRQDHRRAASASQRGEQPTVPAAAPVRWRRSRSLAHAAEADEVDARRTPTVAQDADASRDGVPRGPAGRSGLTRKTARRPRTGPRSAGPVGCTLQSRRGLASLMAVTVVDRRQTRAVSLLIRHAAPPTKIASQATRLTTQATMRQLAGAAAQRASSATPYIGVQ